MTATPGAIARVVAWFNACRERRRQRKLLATLNDHALRDMALDAHALRGLGVTRADPRLEAERRIWRV